MGPSMSGDPRTTVLGILRMAEEPVTAAQVAQQLGVHVTTARFHLRNLVDDGKAASVVLRSESAGRPRTGYVAVNELAVDNLLSILLGHLGGSPEEREQTGVLAGRQWAAKVLAGTAPADPAMFPDPATVTADALRALGFKVSNVLSAFGTHEITMCSCPLRQVGTSHPEIARGIARGAVEYAIESSSPALAGQYGVHVIPAPDGDCEITLRLARSAAFN
ncbi:MAG: transcriptional regulator [Gordonia sp.]|nr:transcriptional regulator [Gordonia sp. (in: high G+C Gram-positive bacteria)]